MLGTLSGCLTQLRRKSAHPELQDQLSWLFIEGAFRGFSAGPSSGSFSTAAGVCYRSRDFPHGRPGLRPEAFAKVQADNLLLSFLLGLVDLAKESGALYIIENPAKSWLWKQEAWNGMQADDFLCDMCVFGTRWRKPTRVRTNCSLAGQRLLCGCARRHAMLRGRDCKTGVLWTKLAEAYPRRFCTLLANAIASDLNWNGNHRPLDIAKCAKCSGARIGEAGNPGPRGARKPRPPLVLRDIKAGRTGHGSTADPGLELVS